MDLVYWSLFALVKLALLGFVGCRFFKRKPQVTQAASTPPDDSAYKISYVPSEMERSGSSSGALPHKTRAQGMKTMASLVKHGFLSSAGNGTYAINDSGLNALAVCSVRY